LPGPVIGIGSALRTARQERGKTIEEAARDTKIRSEYLEALESESFDSLKGDVYVRGFLRSYAQYLGLNPDKVSAAYSEKKGGPVGSEPPPELSRADTRPVVTFRSRQLPSSWIIAGGVALIALIMFSALGLLSASHSSPPATPLPSASVVVSPPDNARRVTVSLVADHEVAIVVTVDGVQQFAGNLMAREARSFSGTESIAIQLARGGVVQIQANGSPAATPGQPNKPYVATYTPPPEPSPGSRKESPSPTP
jgi:cytoskeletal protein RodZ